MDVRVSLLIVAAASTLGCRAKTSLDVTGAATALERVTTEPVAEMTPAISPDGKTLLFGVTASGKRTIVGVDPNTRARRTLFTSDANISFHPAWLRDGSSYVYVSDSPGISSLVRALTAAPNAAINVVAAGEIAPNPSSPTLSADGTRVAFCSAGNIAVINLDGSRLTILGEGFSPAWSPAGTRLAFVRRVAGHAHLFTVNADSGTDLVQLTSGNADYFAPAWSPDGRYVVFSRAETKDVESADVLPKTSNLYIVAQDGTEVAQLTQGTAGVWAPSWSSDNWIYFSSNQTGNDDIWRIRPTGKYALLGSAGPAEKAAPAAPPPVPAATPEGAPPAPTQPTPAATTESGCTKDTDCKGDRVCESGKCIAPEPQPAPRSR